MKKLIIGITFLVFAFIVLTVFTNNGKPQDNLTTYSFEFEEEEELGDVWLASGWGKISPSQNLLDIKDGVLTLSLDTMGEVPYLFSKPFPVNSKSIITIKRKVRFSHGSGTFAGGLAMYQTDDTEMLPEKTLDTWNKNFGDGIALIEYSYNLKAESDRPGRDVFRVLAADWEYNDNYELLKPIYGEWVEEQLIFDMRSNKITYVLGDEVVSLNSYFVDKPAIRFLMHPYGTGSGNKIEIDYLEVTIEQKPSR